MLNNNITNKIKSLKIIVLGDLMLDVYIYGEVKRISPEAPVPVITVKNNYSMPGGAANVAFNLKQLGVNTELYGVIGKDTEGDKLISSLKKHKINTSGIIRVGDRPTTSKTRVLAENQQIVRCDNEITKVIEKRPVENILSKIKKSFGKHNPDAVIISDYNKGTVSREIISGILKINKTTKALIVADPKGKVADKYKDVDLITPNSKEVSDLSGIEVTDNKTLIKAINYLIDKCKLSAIAVTQGKKGIAFKTKRDELFNISSIARDVYDVTGAGDTVISTLVVSYLLTNDWKLSVETANASAGLVIGRVGTSSISQTEFLDILEQDKTRHTKSLGLEQLKSEILKHKQRKKKIVFTNGCFDILHPGHIKLLKKAKSLGDILVVGLNSDRSVRKLKGENRPVIKQTQRLQIISLLDVADYITIFNEETPIRIIEEILPDIIVKGGDYTPESVVGGKLVESYGGRIYIEPLHKNYSTTSIVNKVKKNL